MINNNFPPNINANSRVILFDGVCKLCNFWSQFIITHDKHRIFKLASVQSIEGQKILKHFNMPTEYFDTMLYIEGCQSFKKSDAFINIMKQLKQPWKSFVILQLFPKWLRDWLYDRIALNRYFLFGKYDRCLLPTADHESRYLNQEKSDDH